MIITQINGTSTASNGQELKILKSQNWLDVSEVESVSPP